MKTTKRPGTEFYYHIKGFKWYLYNMILGVSPVLVIWVIADLTHYKWGSHVIENLIHKEAIIIFASCILMGAVMIDFWIGSYHLNKYQGFLVYAFPCVSLLVFFFQYFLLHENIVLVNLFDMNSIGTQVRLLISFIYCVRGKSHLYLQEDRKEKATAIKIYITR